MQGGFEFAKLKHGSQVRKYTGVPYTDHLEEVASMVAEYTDDLDAIRAALLHDTLEDTDTMWLELYNTFGGKVADIVQELTDHYTSQAFPMLNRATRKKLECERRQNLSKEAKLIKAADHINNVTSIAEYDKSFAKIYIPEIIASMDSIWLETTLHHKLKEIISLLVINL